MNRIGKNESGAIPPPGGGGLPAQNPGNFLVSLRALQRVKILDFSKVYLKILGEDALDPMTHLRSLGENPSSCSVVERLKRFRLSQIMQQPKILDFLDFREVENNASLTYAFFNIPAQQPRQGSCAITSMQILLWANQPLGYLRLAKQCQQNPPKVAFHLAQQQEGQQFIEVTAGSDRELHTRMDCALGNLAESTTDGIRRRKLNDVVRGLLTAVSGIKLSKAAKAKDSIKISFVDGEYQIFFDKQAFRSALEGAAEDDVAWCLERIDNEIAALRRQSRGNTLDYAKHLTTDATMVPQPFKATKDGLEHLLEVVSGLPRDGKPLLSASVSTKRGLGHAFNLIRQDFRPHALSDLPVGGILFLGLSNHPPDRGIPLVGIQKREHDEFKLVSYSPQNPTDAQPIVGELAVTLVNIFPANFRDQKPEIRVLAPEIGA